MQPIRKLFAAENDDAAGHGQSAGHVGLVLLVSGVCGLYFGLTSGWQIAVESAQAVAGVVSYPADNPFYMYHVKSWTLLHQLPAALLACGCSEQMVSLLVACVPAVLGFQALALLTYTFGRDRMVASLVPVTLLAANAWQDCGAVYPIRLISNVYWATYGVTGTNYVLFAWALWGVGWRRPAALLCGLAPAMHPALGAWCIAAILAALICDRRAERPFVAVAARWFAAGILTTIISFAVQQYLSRNVPPADPVLTQQLLRAFVADWDNHRFAFPLEHVEWRLGWCALALFAAARAWLAESLPRRSLVLLNVLLISALAGLAMCLLTYLSPWLPTPLVMAMPGRFINLAVVALPAVMIGLLSRGTRAWSVNGLLAALLLFGGLRSLTLLKQWIYVPAAPKIFLASGLIVIYLIAAQPTGTRGWLKSLVRAAAALCLVLVAFLELRDWHLAALLLASVVVLQATRRWLNRPAWPSLRIALRAVSLGAPAVVMVMMVGGWLASGLLLFIAAFDEQRLGWLFGTWRRASLGGRAARWATCIVAMGFLAGSLGTRARLGVGSLRAWDNDPVFAAAAKVPGLLLTVPRMGIAQLRTRRGLVLYGQALNQITYVPASGPAINRVLKGVYDDDLLKPRPPGWVKCGGIMHDSAHGVWEDRGADEWQRLAKEFGFSAILTYPDWRLKLPIAAQTNDLILYRVPEAVSTASRSPRTNEIGIDP